jgi:hypothetical protein
MRCEISIAILRVAARKDMTRDLFADPQLDHHKAASKG